ncbi:MAG: thioredoxin family protein [Candidatus Aminicenantales bacterium]
MKNKRTILMILALAAIFYGQGTSGVDSDPGLSSTSIPQETDAPENGKVWVTNRLDIDFSKQLMTFIEIGADRCIPCKAMQPIMKEIAAAYAGRVQVVFYDVWKDPAPGRKYQIQLIPTQVFIDQEGKEVYRHVGIFPKEEIIALLKEQGVS